MKINIKYIHNKQAVQVDGADWKVEFQNHQKFTYENALFNGERLTTGSVEQEEGFRGDY